jgi:uncharacterized membrane protein HdeD (DUF308 family)
MITTLTRNWWALVLRGVLAIFFGLAAFVWPGLTILSLTFVFGFYALLDGIFALVAAWSNRRHERWWVLLLEGLLGIAAGVIAFISPGITALALLSVIVVWAILTGILEIMAAIRLRREIQNEWWLALGGLFSIIFGALLLLWPESGLVTISWIIGGYAIAFGVMMLMLGFRLQGMHKTIKREAAGILG